MRIRFLIALIAIILSGCQSATPTIDPPTPVIIEKLSETPSATPLPTRTATLPPLTTTPTPPQLPEEWVLWNDSPHKSAAQGITCETCHVGKESTKLDGEALCKSCHKDAEKASSPSAPTETAHSAHASLQCLNCHNPHSTRASCTNAGCHESVSKQKAPAVATPDDGHPYQSGGDSFCGGSACHPEATQAALEKPIIHGGVHSAVACIACHDASGAKVARSEVTGDWLLLTPVATVGMTPPPYSSLSHAVTKNVDCQRCHFEDNPWGLPVGMGQ